MPGLLSDAQTVGDEASRDIGLSVTNATRKSIGDLNQRYETRNALGNIAGAALGKQLVPGVGGDHPAVAASHQASPGIGGLLAVLGKQIFPGFLGSRRPMGQASTPALGSAAAFELPTYESLVSPPAEPDNYVEAP